MRHQDVDATVHDATAVLCPLTIPTPPQHHPSHATLDVPQLVALSRATTPLTFWANIEQRPVLVDSD